MHKHIVITGASSGIGAALALEYASVGVRLSLCGRDQMRLSATAETCRAKGADVEAQILDVTDAEKMRAWLEACDGQRPVDMVIANAGISGGTDGMFSGGERGAGAPDFRCECVWGAQQYSSVTAAHERARARAVGHHQFAGGVSRLAGSAGLLRIKSGGAGLWRSAPWIIGCNGRESKRGLPGVYSLAHDRCQSISDAVFDGYATGGRLYRAQIDA
jgi:NAD(P)-dependent dehydrogenase (short-subunit alcohol dehydrogenase family)